MSKRIAAAAAAFLLYGIGSGTVGALLELATGRSLAVIFAVPGGLFELALGLYLVRYGFRRPAAIPTAEGSK